ncbi:hypothetical protein AVEN_8246-1 [Araneus ventricosus]|uniref:Uncharacterized protein n=1 Tax=Araneus ventricosus TaxID=182803 RepID=A0A4Y2L0V4_ARAVE|nr:hypothetical protein AVEN_8246-1 [Araneus ventricosus]
MESPHSYPEGRNQKASTQREKTEEITWVPRVVSSSTPKEDVPLRVHISSTIVRLSNVRKLLRSRLRMNAFRISVSMQEGYLERPLSNDFERT